MTPEERNLWDELHEPDRMAGRPIISWDKEKLNRFKTIVTKANEAKADVINFDGHQFHVDYALYLIEFLESQLE